MYNYLLLLKYILLLQSTIVRNRNENDQFVQFFFSIVMLTPSNDSSITL